MDRPTVKRWKSPRSAHAKPAGQRVAARQGRHFTRFPGTLPARPAQRRSSDPPKSGICRNTQPDIEGIETRSRACAGPRSRSKRPARHRGHRNPRVRDPSDLAGGESQHPARHRGIGNGAGRRCSIAWITITSNTNPGCRSIENAAVRMVALVATGELGLPQTLAVTDTGACCDKNSPHETSSKGRPMRNSRV
jgi:hypothetical protein